MPSIATRLQQVAVRANKVQTKPDSGLGEHAGVSVATVKLESAPDIQVYVRPFLKGNSADRTILEVVQCGSNGLKSLSSPIYLSLAEEGKQWEILADKASHYPVPYKWVSDSGDLNFNAVQEDPYSAISAIDRTVTLKDARDRYHSKKNYKKFTDVRDPKNIVEILDGDHLMSLSNGKKVPIHRMTFYGCETGYASTRLNFMPNLQVAKFIAENKNIGLFVDLRHADEIFAEKEFWPSEGEKEIGPYTIKKTGVGTIEGYDYIDYSLSHKDGEEVQAKRVIRAATADHSATSSEKLDELTNVIEKQREQLGCDILISCAHGLGRTGTAMQAVAIKKLAREQKLTLATVKDRFLELVGMGVKNRGPNFVEYATQREALFGLMKNLAWRQQMRDRPERTRITDELRSIASARSLAVDFNTINLLPMDELRLMKEEINSIFGDAASTATTTDMLQASLKNYGMGSFPSSPDNVQPVSKKETWETISRGLLKLSAADEAARNERKIRDQAAEAADQQFHAWRRGGNAKYGASRAAFGGNENIPPRSTDLQPNLSGMQQKQKAIAVQKNHEVLKVLNSPKESKISESSAKPVSEPISELTPTPTPTVSLPRRRIAYRNGTSS
jgi:protein-tyrosine phosphatase